MSRRSPRFASAAALLLCLKAEAADPQVCEPAPRVSRQEIREAMRPHGGYSLTSTTTSMVFASHALLRLVHQRRRSFPGSTQLLINHADWFAAHLETAGVPYDQMSESARAGFEHRQDVLVSYGPGVVKEVLEGPPPISALEVTLAWPDTGDVPPTFSYRDTLTVPEMVVFNDRVIRFRVIEYDSALVFDEVTGISVRPSGFMSAVFTLIGRPDLRQTRLAVSRDYWQVVRGRFRVLPGVSKSGTAFIEPGGRGHERVPAGRADLQVLAERLRQRVELRYGPPSCQAKLWMRTRERVCNRTMGGLGSCPGGG